MHNSMEAQGELQFYDHKSFITHRITTLLHININRPFLSPYPSFPSHHHHLSYHPYSRPL